jgi:hypothetical protein
MICAHRFFIIKAMRTFFMVPYSNSLALALPPAAPRIQKFLKRRRGLWEV